MEPEDRSLTDEKGATDHRDKVTRGPLEGVRSRRDREEIGGKPRQKRVRWEGAADDTRN